MTPPVAAPTDPIALAAALRAQGWRRVEIVQTRGGLRVILDDGESPPRREVTSGRKRA
jgi:hypothetical protein